MPTRAKRLRNSGGVFVVVRRLEDLVEALRELDGAHQEARGGLFISDAADPILEKSLGNAPLGAETSR
jgi:hypothetical protein